MATRITKRTTLVQSPKVNPQVRQAIADLSRVQTSGTVRLSTGQNVVLAMNDPNVHEVQLDADTTYYLGHQTFSYPTIPSTIEDTNNHSVWNNVRVVGQRGTKIVRSNADSGAIGTLWIKDKPSYLYNSNSRYRVEFENITFEVPVVLYSSSKILFKNCVFTQTYQAYTLVNWFGDLTLENCHFPSDGSTPTSVTELIHNETGPVVIKNCTADVRPDVCKGIYFAGVQLGCDISGCDFWPEIASGTNIGFDLRNQSVEHMMISGNNGIMVT